MRTIARARPLTTYIVGLALAMTIPPLLLSVAVATRWVSAERSQVRADLSASAAVVQELIDRYLGGRIAMLQALATSPAFDTNDLGGLDRQAREIAALQGTSIVMRDLSGQQMINTRLAPGAPLPRVDLTANDRRAIDSREPVVADLAIGAVSRQALVRIIVPVVRHDRTIAVLVAGLEPALLSDALRQIALAPSITASIVDSSGTILARSDGTSDLVGRTLRGFPALTGSSGTWSGVNLREREVLGAYRRSAMSGWMMAVGIECVLLDALLYRSLWMMGLLTLLLGAVALVTSIAIARRMIGSLRQVADAAQVLGEGRIVDAPLTPIRETNLIGVALSATSAKLREQADALVEANRELESRVEARTREMQIQGTVIRATLDNMDQGLMLIEADGRVPICNRRAMELLDLPDELFATPPSFIDILRFQLEQQDFARSGETLKQWVEAGGLERRQHSYERERPNGTVLEIRTVPLADGSAVRTYTDITDRKRAERLSDHLARHDPLTGLPNRRLFHERLADQIAAAGESGTTFAAFYVDLDRFKIVNDTLGHAAGDALLCQVAGRIGAAVGGGDTVARLGGDEFAVIQVDPDQPAAAERLARTLNEVMNAPVRLDGQPVTIGMSIGVAFGHGSEAPDTVFGHADEALYRAKREGRNVHRFHDPSWGTEPGERQLLELDLQHALARGEFELRYQPIVSARTRAVVGFEALLRWRHPERGMVPPVEFIQLAEETLLIVPIGAWVLGEACRAAAAWPGDTTVAVNISAVQVEHDHLFATVMKALATSGLAPYRLELEITESVLARGNESMLAALRLLRGVGVRVALDDFGTGYSSLAYLQNFPLDRLKIDRAFTAASDQPATAAIMRAIVGLGTELGMAITAEGVETEEQFATVRRQGCTEVQGYLIRPPVRLEDATVLLGVDAARRVA